MQKNDNEENKIKDKKLKKTVFHCFKDIFKNSFNKISLNSISRSLNGISSSPVYISGNSFSLKNAENGIIKLDISKEFSLISDSGKRIIVLLALFLLLKIKSPSFSHYF